MHPNSRTHLSRLDGLRGIAVLSVVLFHAGPFLVPSVSSSILPGGFLGVDLFFVLSGFLMTNILLEPGRRYGSFYVRRVARIFPALYVFLAAQLLYSWEQGGALIGDFRAYFLISTGLGNWGSAVGITLPFGLGQTWSLGVEEQLYLLWPLVLVVFARRDVRRLKWLCAAGIALSLVVKLAMFRSGVTTPEIYGQTEGRLDDFLVGAFVAAATRSGIRPLPWLRPLTYVAGGVLVFALATTNPFHSAWLYEGGFTAVALCAGIVLYACLQETADTRFTDWVPLRVAGRYSYSIYLWHPLVFLAVMGALPHHTALRVACAAVLLCSLSAASTRLIEEPFRRLAARATSARRVSVRPVLAMASGGS